MSQESWNSQTIEMIDALITHARLLNDRLRVEYRRLHRLPDAQWHWLSEEVQVALADLRHNDAFTDLLYPRDNEAMQIIHQAAGLIRTKSEKTPA